MEMYKSNNGKSFVAMQDPYLTGTGKGYYAALAFCPDDASDEDGYVPVYELRWEILPEDEYDPECGDESCACDWDSVDGYYVVGDMPATDKAEYI